jgi:hypothetical protein
MGFVIDHLAIHLVDAQRGQPDFAEDELVLGRNFENAADRATVQRFLDEHLTSIWRDETAEIADLHEGSSVLRLWQQFQVNGTTFLELSKELATLLHQVSPANATRGLLIVVQFSPEDRADKYLALLKLDPGDRDVLRLEERQGQVILDLAVEHIKLALPDPRGVLKWALLPHPSLPGVGAKLKDRQSTGIEAAVYFIKYLGAGVRPRDNVAVNALVAGTKSYLEARHPTPKMRAALPAVIKEFTDRLQRSEMITPRIVADIVSETAGLPDVDADELAAALEEKKATEIKLTTPAALPNQTVTYELNNGIKISGKSSVMESQVRVDPVANEIVFTIHAARYTIRRSAVSS